MHWLPYRGRLWGFISYAYVTVHEDCRWCLITSSFFATARACSPPWILLAVWNYSLSKLIVGWVARKIPFRISHVNALKPSLVWFHLFSRSQVLSRLHHPKLINILDIVRGVNYWWMQIPLIIKPWKSLISTFFQKCSVTDLRHVIYAAFVPPIIICFGLP